MLTNYHTHTTRCGHAEGTEEEYILTALRCGFKVLGFSDHTPWAYATPGFVSRIRMLPSQLDDYVLTLRRLREKYADKLHIRIGLEAEYFPAYLGWLREETERLDIEYLILGCHYDGGQSGFLVGWCQATKGGTFMPLLEVQHLQKVYTSRFGGSISTAHGRRYAEQVVEALETGLYRYLAHPDLFLNRVTAFDADAEKACRDICAAAARLDIPLEYNMAGLTLQDRPDGSLGYTRDEFWHIAAEYPVKAIVGCDAHAPSELDVVPAIEEKKAFLHSLGIPVLDTLPGLE
jgi:histidinol-phosphatase (PHP family)